MPAKPRTVVIRVTLENDPRAPESNYPVITRVVVDEQDVTKTAKVPGYSDGDESHMIAHGNEDAWWALLLTLTDDEWIEHPDNPFIQGDADEDPLNDSVDISGGAYDEPYELIDPRFLLM